MKLRFALIFAALAVAFPVQAQKNPPLRVFIRASEKTHGPGAHDYPQFLQDWTKLLNERGAVARGSLWFPTRDELDRTDVLVLYASDGSNIGPEDRTSHNQIW